MLFNFYLTPNELNEGKNTTLFHCSHLVLYRFLLNLELELFVQVKDIILEVR